jgi:hypothetical protein
MPVCAQCATENPEIAKFCLACSELDEPGRARLQPHSARVPALAERAAAAHAIEVVPCRS